VKAVPKPEPAKTRKAALSTRYRVDRAACVWLVFQRERSRCERCQKRVLHASDPMATPFTVGHVHEHPPRSLGGNPTHPDDCHLYCAACHALAHNLRTSCQQPRSKRSSRESGPF
jgi:hypothetical protein